MIVPERRLLLLLGGVVLGAAAAVVFPSFVPLWGMATAILLCVAAVDALVARRIPAPAVERQVPGSLSLGAMHAVELTLEPRGKRALDVSVFDHVPEQTDAEGLPVHLKLLPGGKTGTSYRLRPRQRGAHVFGRTEVRLRSRLVLAFAGLALFWGIRRV